MSLPAQDIIGSISGGLVFPVPGHPLCVQIEEQIEHSPDGSAPQTMSGTIHRDQAGRMRTEWTPVSPGSSIRPTTIVDPVESSILTLESVSKTAIRVTVPASRPEQFGFSLPHIVNPLPHGRWKTETESSEQRNIAGVDFEGTRMTNISEDQSSLRMVYEWWASKTLGLIGLAIASGPNGKHTLRIRHIDWRIPDPALFTVPSDYVLRELHLPGPDRE